MTPLLVLSLLAAEPETPAPSPVETPAAEAPAPATEAPPPAASDPEPRAPKYSVTLDIGGPIVIGALLRTYGNFLEFQFAVSKRFSLIAEFTYLHSENFRTLDGTFPGVRMRLAIFCAGAAFWFFRPFSGPFISMRVEGWFGAAQSNVTGVAVLTNAFDVNLQPGWQFDFGGFTLIASVSLAYVTGPHRSTDGTVTFPLHGFSGTPHIRVGYAW